MKRGVWVTIDATRVLRVAHGRDTILCDCDLGTPPQLVVLLSQEAADALRDKLEHRQAGAPEMTSTNPTTLRPVRDEALDKLAIVITAEWGRRCDRFETGCASCMAWAVFDMMEKITDGSALDDPDDYKRVMESYGRWEGAISDRASSQALLDN